MSVEYCHYCDAYIDTDFDAEHFTEVEGTEYTCLQEAVDKGAIFE